MPVTHDQKQTFEVRVKLYQHGHRGKNAICKVGNWEKYPCQGRYDIRKPVKSLSIHEVTSNLSNEYVSIHRVEKSVPQYFHWLKQNTISVALTTVCTVQVIPRHYRHL